MSEQRPRPQYGEYASSEERLAAGGAPLEPAPPRPDTRIDPVELATPATPAAPLAAKRPSIDPAITAGLLGFGLVYIIIDVVPDAFNYSASVQRMFDTFGIGDFTPTAFSDGVGVATLISQVVIYIAAVVISYRRVRAGKRAFFVPLVGALLAGIVSSVLSYAVLTSDPAMNLWIEKLLAG